MAGIPCSPYRGHGFDPWLGNWIPQAGDRACHNEKIPHAATETWCSQIDRYIYKPENKSVGKDMEQLESFCAAGGDVKWCGCGTQSGGPSKKKS